MTFSTPQSEDSPTYPAQAVIDATDLAAILASSSQTGLMSGCAVTPNSSGVNLNVNVASGSVLVAGATVAVSAATNVPVAAASSGDRRDIVTVNSSGTVVVTAGTPCSIAGWTSTSLALPPVKPAIPASSCLLAEVYVPGAATSITASNLVAKAAQTATSAAKVVNVRYVGGAITLNSSTAVVEVAAATGGPGTGGLDVVIAAAAGDVLLVGAQIMLGTQAVTVTFDVATIVSAAVVNTLSGAALSTANNGVWTADSSDARGDVGLPIPYTVQAGDVSGGNVTLRLYYQTFTASNRTLSAAAAQPLFIYAVNLHH